jgi:hypothetical protein
LGSRRTPDVDAARVARTTSCPGSRGNIPCEQEATFVIHGLVRDEAETHGLGGVEGGAGGIAKDFTALGGKVGSAGPGVETEEGEGVKVGDDGAKLLTFGVGEVDKDAVLQAGQAQIDRVKAASQQVVFEVLNIVGGLGGGGIEAPGLGLVKKVIDEVNELAAGFGNFGDHINLVMLRFRSSYTSLGRIRPIPLCMAAARVRLGTSRWEKASGISSGANSRATAAGFFDRPARAWGR